MGVASGLPIAGKHVFAAACQMHNRGNGKGAGIAAAGLDAVQMGVDQDTLKTHYLLQIALLDGSVHSALEKDFIFPVFDVAQGYAIEHRDEGGHLRSPEGRPPDVWRYFVRVKPHILELFAAENDLQGLAARAVEDEFVYQNSFRLNRRFYASLGEKRAFVLSHGRDLMVLKIVGYVEDLGEYYRLGDLRARVWIAHQRYPTKGRVWHPGGAHPFVGLNEALVHNGDLANYHAICEYLSQRNIVPLYLTDTEVAVQLFDLFDRIYSYPLEVTLEALAPTTEYDFTRLPAEKQELYRLVQRTHIHGSPDGPWFFILARSRPDQDQVELVAIADTSMLRPQVFALYENRGTGRNGSVQIGLVASERQAINAVLRSLAAEDDRIQPMADTYWVTRGGSHTDGGAFRFVVTPQDGLVCKDKFGVCVTLTDTGGQVPAAALNSKMVDRAFCKEWEDRILQALKDEDPFHFFLRLETDVASLGWTKFRWMLQRLLDLGRRGDSQWQFVWQVLNLLRDRRYGTGQKKRAAVLNCIDQSLVGLFAAAPRLIHDKSQNFERIRRVDWDTRRALRPPQGGERLLVMDALFFPAEGDNSAARWMVQAYQMGWKDLIAFNWRGGRFAASGFGAETDGLRVDLYGDIGDYAGSGLDGAEVHLHGDGQDQVGQIVKSGKLVIYGDVGQTFLYGAKGGEVFVRGSAAGRPLINAVGKPRVVINGLCLDYLAESFMAGDPLQGGGFVILNGIFQDKSGRLKEMATPYPGGNLFSLASGGAVYLRDPRQLVSPAQLNGGVFADLREADWLLIQPYLLENERLFGIRLDELLRVNGQLLDPLQVYRKVAVGASQINSELANR